MNSPSLPLTLLWGWASGRCSHQLLPSKVRDYKTGKIREWWFIYKRHSSQRISIGFLKEANSHMAINMTCWENLSLTSQKPYVCRCVSITKQARPCVDHEEAGALVW